MKMQRVLLFVIAWSLTIGPGGRERAQEQRPVTFDDIMSMKNYHQLDRLKRQRDWIVKYTLGGGGRKTTTQ
jgi:hypothetical protein